MLHYFQYIKKPCSGYRKVAQNNDIKVFKNLKVVGLEIKCWNDLIFTIDNQLYRKLKLSNLSEFKSKGLKFLDFMISRSEKVEDVEQTSLGLYGSYSGQYFSSYYDYEEEENKEKRIEYRNRRNMHNNLYKQKLKVRR